MQRALFPDIRAFSPLRDKRGHLPHDVPLNDTVGDHHPLVMPRSTFLRDFHDVQTADLILVNLLGAPRVSQGTIYEIAWAFAFRKPIVVVIDSTGDNPHEHLFLDNCMTYRTDGLAEACEITRSVLLP